MSSRRPLSGRFEQIRDRRQSTSAMSGTELSQVRFHRGNTLHILSHDNDSQYFSKLLPPRAHAAWQDTASLDVNQRFQDAVLQSLDRQAEKFRNSLGMRHFSQLKYDVKPCSNHVFNPFRNLSASIFLIAVSIH